MPTRLPLSQEATLPGALPGSVVLVGMRTMLWRFFFIALGVQVMSSGTRSACAPAAGTGVEQCTRLSLGPSPFVLIAMFAVTIWVLGALIRRTSTEAEAIDFINSVSLWVLGIVGAGIVLAQIYFWMIPVEGWPQPNMWFSPFPFMNLNVETYPG